MQRIGLVLGLLTVASMASAEQPAVPRDLTETTAPFAWLPGNAGTDSDGIRIRRGLIPEPPTPEVTPASLPSRSERARARIERDRALRLVRAANQREVVIIVTDRHPEQPLAETPPERILKFVETTR